MTKARIRQLDRRGSRSEKSPTPGMTRRTPGNVACHACGALFTRKTWRRDHTVPLGAYDRVIWRICPACRQYARGEAFGKVVLPAAWAAEHAEELQRRLDNVAARAGYTQPQRRIVGLERAGRSVNVLTTSQKLAHRVAREIEKLFGGRATYRWSSNDGSLTAIWSPTAPRQGAAARKRTKRTGRT
ncbi:MAG: hypothetical protein OZ922_10650 [Myxococcales bacterium]|nr:hypothetical protein [Myxococcales bacterium]